MKVLKKIGNHFSKNELWYNLIFAVLYLALLFIPMLKQSTKGSYFLIFRCLKVDYVGSNITNCYIIMASIISSIILLLIDSIKVIKKKHIIITPVLLLINIVSYAIFPMVNDNGFYYPQIYVAWILISIQIIIFALYLFAIYEEKLRNLKLPKTKTQKLQDELTLLKLRMSEKEDMLKEREQLVNSINTETDPEQKKKLQSALDYLDVKINEVNVKER